MDSSDFSNSWSGASSSSQNAEPPPTLLQKKIDAVQQIVTLFESTMASGKFVHEENVSSIQMTIDKLEKSIENLKSRKSFMEADFKAFSELVEGEIMRFCALDNILRTVEQSGTENDIKILLPDVSKMDKYVQAYSQENNDIINEWGRLKEEIKRLNSESESDSMRSITLRVTLKNKILNFSQSTEVNGIAMAINERRGKSMNRTYLRSEIPTYSMKYMKINWNQNNFVAAEHVIQHLSQIVKDVFRGEGDVVRIEFIEHLQQGSIVDGVDLRNIHLQKDFDKRIQQREQELNPSKIVLYRVGAVEKQPVPTSSTQIPNSQSSFCSTLQTSSNNGDDDVVLLSQQSSSMNSGIPSSHLRNSFPVGGPLNAISDPSLPNHLNISQPLLNSSSSTQNSQNQTTTASSNTSHPPTINNTISHPPKLQNIISPPIVPVSNANNTSIEINNIETTSSTTIPVVGCENGLQDVTNVTNVVNAPAVINHDEVQKKKAAQRYANAKLRNFLAKTLNSHQSSKPYKRPPLSNLSSLSSSFVLQNSNLLNDSNNMRLQKSGDDAIPPSSITEIDDFNSSAQLPPSCSLVEPKNQSNLEDSAEENNNENFDGMKLDKNIISCLKKQNLTRLIDFQKELLPKLLIERKDVICRADKQAGKSTALVIGILQKVDSANLTPQVLVALPTPACTCVFIEIVKTLGENLKIICRNADEIIDGSFTSSSYMESKKRSEGHILVGIPSSILKLLKAQKFQNEAVKALMLDDLDAMLGQGLKPIILQVVYALNAYTQIIATTTKLTTAVVEFRKNLTSPVNISQTEVFPPIVEDEHILAEVQNTPDTIPSNLHQKPLKSSNQRKQKPMPRRFKKKISSSSSANLRNTLQNINSNSQNIPIGELTPSNSDNEILVCSSSTNESECESADDEMDCDNKSTSSSVNSTTCSSDSVIIVSDENEVEDYENYSMTMSSRSSEEIETMLCADDLFGINKEVMTVIPDYIYRQLGIPSSGNNDVVAGGLKDKSSSSHCSKSEHFYIVLEQDEDEMKIETISLLNIEDEKTIVFCNTISKVEWLSSVLRHRKLWPQCLHEDMTKKEWTPVLQNFSRGNFCKLLVVTDFLAEVSLHSASLIINYDLPFPPRNYTSRAAFAERRVATNESSQKNPMVISFIKKDNLSDIKDLKNTYNLQFMPMATAKSKAPLA